MNWKSVRLAIWIFVLGVLFYLVAALAYHALSTADSDDARRAGAVAAAALYFGLKRLKRIVGDMKEPNPGHA